MTDQSPKHGLPPAATVRVTRVVVHPETGDLPVAELVREMARRWAGGERPPAEEFLARHPGFGQEPGAALKLIYEEFHLRRRHGEAPEREDYYRRFPQWRPQLEVLLGGGDSEPTTLDAAVLPRVGEQLGDFQLLRELGRGALGRVFLARQTALADRPVVLKVTPRAGSEHLSLARLQHTHVVPLYSVQHDEWRDLRVLCMPYFGGATLARLLEAVRDVPVEQRTGRHLAEALDRAGDETLPGAAGGPARQFLARATYPEALCWVGACLADALHYAHEHGLVHLDVKPSNILLAGDGTPMLLDFHLAQAPLRPGDALPDTLGGTLAYMPPEQHEAMAARRAGGAAPAALDGRADLFALGAVLYAALGGQVPVPDGDSPPLCALNPAVAVGLSDVVAKCLAGEPRDRYPTAATLAADLRRHLAGQPLQGVPNRSLRERWRKWRRRRPHGLALTLMLLAVLGSVLAVGLTLVGHVRQARDRARADLDHGLAEMEQRRFAQAARAFRRGLDAADGLPFEGELARQLRDEFDRAERADAAAQLHALADRLRFLYGADLSPAEARRVGSDCDALWQQRERIVNVLEEDAGARADLLDLAVLWADLHARLGTEPEVKRRREALRVLAEAEGLLGPSPALCREREAHAEALGLPAEACPAAELPPRSAWDHYALGLFLLRNDRAAAVPAWGGPPALAGALAGLAQRVAADAAFRRAVALEPGGLWPNLYLGRSAYRLGRYHEAVGAFSVCVGRAPLVPRLYLDRALAHAALGEEEQALRDAAHAGRLDPRYAGRAADVHYNLGVAALARGRRLAAASHLREALRTNDGHGPAQELLRRLGGQSR